MTCAGRPGDSPSRKTASPSAMLDIPFTSTILRSCQPPGLARSGVQCKDLSEPLLQGPGEQVRICDGCRVEIGGHTAGVPVARHGDHAGASGKGSEPESPLDPGPRQEHLLPD